jgi:hypothetical protein
MAVVHKAPYIPHTHYNRCMVNNWYRQDIRYIRYTQYMGIDMNR